MLDIIALLFVEVQIDMFAVKRFCFVVNTSLESMIDQEQKKVVVFCCCSFFVVFFPVKDLGTSKIN